MNHRPPRHWLRETVAKLNPNRSEASFGLVQIASFGTRTGRTKRKLKLARLEEIRRTWCPGDRLTAEECEAVFRGVDALETAAESLLERLKKARMRKEPTHGG